MTQELKSWYRNWFDSPYYHLLYATRDEDEAARFIGNLETNLHIQKGSIILDQACGRGRHARILNQLGFDVHAIDLSAHNIEYCKRYEKENLHFYVQDMRRPFRIRYFDLILNLFTSFGYFKSDHQQQLVVNSAAQSLKPGGRYVIDFLNTYRTVRELVPESEVRAGGLLFRISRRIEGNFLLKTIRFEDQGTPLTFYERVELMYPEDFIRFFKVAGLDLLSLRGDYELSEFNPEKSDRLILIAGKP